MSASGTIQGTYRPHAVVIGSGFGGLAAAVRLGARGYRVTVLEQSDRPGGKAQVVVKDGFVFDRGPTVVTAPQLFEELWQMAGRRMEDDIDMRSVTPLYNIRFDDGTTFDYVSDHERMVEQIRQFAPGDVDGYERYLELSKEIFELGYVQLAHVPFGTVGSMAEIAPDMIALKSYHTVYGLVSKYVENEKLRQVLSFHTLLVGGNPFTSTSIYCLISYLEQQWGVHFPMGGTGSLVNGLVSLIQGMGNSIRYDARVERITLDGRRATGVRLSSGEVIDADVVVSNADSIWTYKHLVPAHARPHWPDVRLDAIQHSMSVFVWYFGTRRKYEDVEHHTILLGPRYRELLDDIFDRKVLADDFSLYLHHPTATDPSMAPEGMDAFYVLSPVPHTESGTNWEKKAEQYRKLVSRYLSETVLPGLEDELQVSLVLTPQQMAEGQLTPFGSAFGLQPVLPQSAYFRPHNRSEDVENLFFVGAGTHPGAGLPGVLSSARVLDRVVPSPDYLNTGTTDSKGLTGPARQAADMKVARQMLARGSKSFSAASHLLPGSVREPVTALYAFCREADDAVDSGGDVHEAVRILHHRLDRIYRGRPLDSPVDRAFTEVVQTYSIPRALPEALIEGFAWDASGRRHETLSDLMDYSARVASSVGVMMTLIMGPRDPDVLSRAADLGLAMQLTNIARDVGEDARAGRIYLPLSWLRDEGIDPGAFLESPAHSPALGRVVKRLLDVAEAHYRRADEGIPHLPAKTRTAIRAARLIYAAIGGEIARNGYDTVSTRAHTSAATKLGLVARSLPARFEKRPELRLPGHPATRFLVSAVEDGPQTPVSTHKRVQEPVPETRPLSSPAPPPPLPKVHDQVALQI